ncbi:MAG: hypothetical protein KC645_04745, partial [Gemmatimonadetes bacterium]|nr:hypothetical protein [Gemmatimonadota bacterium]
RAPALLLRIESGPGQPIPSLGTTGRVAVPSLPAEATGTVHLGLSPAGAGWRGAGWSTGPWPLGLGDPEQVPERIRRERATALARRTRLAIAEIDPARPWGQALERALAGVDGWVTADAAGAPVAVAAYGPEGAQAATPEQRAELARALLALGAPEDVRAWADAGQLDPGSATALRLWTGGDDRELGDSTQPEPDPFGRLPPPPSPDDGSVPAHVAQARALLHVLHALLGLRPDAPYARVGLAPRCPTGWSGYRLEGLRVGNGEMAFRYRGPGPHRFETEQTWGVTPLSVVLEAWLPVPPDAVVVLDGQPAEPTREPEPGGTRFRLQLPLEAPRTLEISPGTPTAEDT